MMKYCLSVNYARLNDGTLSGTVVEYPECTARAKDVKELNEILLSQVKFVMSSQLEALKQDRVKMMNNDITEILIAQREAIEKEQQETDKDADDTGSPDKGGRAAKSNTGTNKGDKARKQTKKSPKG